MGENTAIQWCTHTFNPWMGCSQVSAGCVNCYAMNLARRQPDQFGVWGDEDQKGTRVLKSGWKDPRAWDRKAAKAGERHRVFCASLADIFEDWKGDFVNRQGQTLYRNGDSDDPVTADDIRIRLFQLIQETSNLDWMLLTKRPQNIEAMLLRAGIVNPPALYPNVWLGTTAENQAMANKRIPVLLRSPAVVRFLSVEPMLERIDLRNFLRSGGIHWVICGGESGARARDFHLEWARSLRDQCAENGVPFFMKQMGSRPKGLDYTPAKRNDTSAYVLDDPHGGDPREWPEDIRIRQEPAVA